MEQLAALVSSFLCLGVPIGVVALIVYFNYRDKKLKQEAFDHARISYKTALDLYASTQDLTHKIEALDKGRMYASMCRDRGLVSMFDEMKLNNDIMVRTK